jgi:hypothetical protein
LASASLVAGKVWESRDAIERRLIRAGLVVGETIDTAIEGAGGVMRDACSALIRFTALPFVCLSSACFSATRKKLRADD